MPAASLLLEFRGAQIPVLYLAGEALAHGLGHFVRHFLPARLDFGVVPGHDVLNGVAHGQFLDIPGKPRLLMGVGARRLPLYFVCRAVVQIGRVTGAAGVAICVKFDELQRPVHHAARAARQRHAVL